MTLDGADFRVLHDNGDMVFVSVSTVSAAGSGVQERAEDAILEKFEDDPDVVVERRS